MHKLYELKEMLCKELEEYGSRDLNVGDLEIVDKLAHAIKNIDKIIMAKEEEEQYSERRGSYREGGNNYREGGNNYYREGNYRDGGNNYEEDSNYYRENSYARGRGRNARRDSRGRYANYYENEMVDELKDLMKSAPDQKTKQEFEKFIQKIEQNM